MRVDRKVFGELREHEAVLACVGKAILRGLEQRFPGAYGFLKLKALTKYGRLPDDMMLYDPVGLVELLEEAVGDRVLLEATIANILAEFTRSNWELARALLSRSEGEIYLRLASLQSPALLKTCGSH